MKKKDIIKLINANEVIVRHNKLLSTIRNQYHNTYYYEKEDFWFPNIIELEEYFKVLKKELIQAKNETLESEKVLNETECTHDIRLKYYSPYGNCNKCILCGYKASSDSSIRFRESNYRNKHTVTFDAKYQEGEEPYEIETGKTEEEVIKILLKILKSYEDEDEIDLVEEFDKLNLKNIDINTEKRKQENYILIIGGTNLEYVDKEKDIYLTKKPQLTSLDFLKYFITLLNTKVAVIDRKETLDNNEFKELKKDYGRVCLYDYTTLGYLETSLFQVKDISFKLIIDLSEICDYEIKENEVNIKMHDLNLKERFPNSHIVKISHLTDKKSLEELKKYLITYKNNEELSILHDSSDQKSYYYLEERQVKKKDFEETCNHIKRLLR